MADKFIPTADEVARIVMLIYGTMGNGGPFWCFVATKPSQVDQVKKLIANKTLDLRSFVDDGYGEIVVSGEGVVPPNDVIKTVSKMFNTPIRQLFAEFNADDVIAKEIERVKKELGEN